MRCTWTWAGSSVSGNSVRVQAGNDLTVRNSAVVGSGDVSLNAVGGNVLITAGQNVRDESHSFEQKQSGFSGTGGSGSPTATAAPTAVPNCTRSRRAMRAARSAAPAATCRSRPARTRPSSAAM
ncbi:hemagglutinin repeat-containing protein [Ralstonia pseudosolanacearum]